MLFERRPKTLGSAEDTTVKAAMYGRLKYCSAVEIGALDTKVFLNRRCFGREMRVLYESRLQITTK